MKPRKSEQHIVCPTSTPMIYTSQQSGHQLSSSVNIVNLYTDADRETLSVGGLYTDSNGTKYTLIRAVALSANLTHLLMQEVVQ